MLFHVMKVKMLKNYLYDSRIVFYVFIISFLVSFQPCVMLPLVLVIRFVLKFYHIVKDYLKFDPAALIQAMNIGSS
jgi:hypothetical protein